MNITIIGVGLIGGSIAAKLKSKNQEIKITGVDLNKDHLDIALDKNLIDTALPFDEGIKNGDLVIVAIPVDATRQILPKVLDQIQENQVVMDVGSTKVKILEEINSHPKRKRFVGFHPMWGTENSGPTFATEESFTNKVAVICNENESDSDAINTVEQIAHWLEMDVVKMNAEEHDLHTAYISHISHITSYALANTILMKEKESDTIFQLASSGFSSTVRLAKSHPEMWVPIFQQNKDNILDVLDEHLHQLELFKQALQEDNSQDLEALIKNANKIKPILQEKG